MGKFQKNNLLKKEGLHTSAFVVGDLVKRFPIYEGLPTVERHRGSIVMQNRLAARYSGEVYLVKHDLPFEARSNVIGFVSPEYVNLFDQIDADIRIKLIPIN